MASDDPISKFCSDDVDVHWDARLCIHIGECGRAQGELFVGGRKPWCQPDLVKADEVVEVTERCPTGALTYIRKDGGTSEHSDQENVVVVSAHGPLYLRGDLDIDGAQAGMPGVRFRAALCRCGASRNKPFCDNAHEAKGFRDCGAVGERGEAATSTGGRLQVRRALGGPLLLQGNFSIIAGSGRVAWKGTKAALCRCGESKNRPFCDGSHREAGFQAD
ncbi:MAG: CDGSH iron-sulfur domain-containing protein [Proteobacteria bacterium]|nr:CDGSH iron-sulfur domain-containing protein [Pseudomonadota bacterium]